MCPEHLLAEEEEALYLLDDLGSDMIEIGIPFSDPIAEGKTIEYAHHKSLENGFNYDDLFKITRKFKDKSNTHSTINSVSGRGINTLEST